MNELGDFLDGDYVAMDDIWRKKSGWHGGWRGRICHKLLALNILLINSQFDKISSFGFSCKPSICEERKEKLFPQTQSKQNREWGEREKRNLWGRRKKKKKKKEKRGVRPRTRHNSENVERASSSIEKLGERYGSIPRNFLRHGRK